MAMEDLIEQETATTDSISPIEDQVQIQKDNAKKSREEEAKILGVEGEYESDDEINNKLVFDIDSKRIRCFAIESLKLYNRQMGTKYKLKRVLEATGNWFGGTTYLIKFIAEEGCSDDEPDNPALMLLLLDKEGDEKVVYDSGDDKVSDQLFLANLYETLHADSIEIDSCEMISEQPVQKDNTEEDCESEDEWLNNGFMLEEHVQIQNNAEEAAARAREMCDSDDDWGNTVTYDPDAKIVRCFAKESLKFYNRKKGTKYKLKRVLEAEASLCAGLCYQMKFTAEEGDGPDEPALKYFKWTKDRKEKEVYDSGNDKVSDRLCEASVYHSISVGKIEVIRCAIKTKEENDNMEEVREKDSDDSEDDRKRQRKKRVRRRRKTPRNQGWSFSKGQKKKLLLLGLVLWICAFIFSIHKLWVIKTMKEKNAQLTTSLTTDL